MYDAVYSVATGDVAGVGCELAAEPRADGKGTEITFTTIFEGSPAEAAGLKAGTSSAAEYYPPTLPTYCLTAHCVVYYSLYRSPRTAPLLYRRRAAGRGRQPALLVHLGRGDLGQGE